ncbi:APOBEC1 complementation factor [Lucilia cuprina]|nr:APOBEC1 complementation factor [Lucilia cuprina]
MFSYYHECYKGTAAYNDATAMPVILENGRKVFGPPQKFTGPRPSHVCELYVTRIPSQLDELGFLVWLHRIGPVYAFRLMMDTGNTTRGYAFVRFCSEKHALAAFELMKYLFVNGERLSVFRSQGKNRLFVSGIPRQLPLSCLEDGFKLCFPNMQSCTAYPALKNNKFMVGREHEENRGFAFIEFEDHEVALAAKKRLNTGRIGMWGADLKIQWAKPKEEMQVAIGLKKCHEGPMRSRLYPHLYQPNDYCAKLRLYCLANNLCIPVVLYGPSFRLFQLQYAGILIKNSFTGQYSYFIFEILVSKICDIHLLICEIAVKMIEECSGELQQNALFRVLNDSKAELVYTFKHYDELKSIKIQNQFQYKNVIIELAASMQILGQQNQEKLLLLYKRSFLTHQPVATFCLDVNNPLTQYCAILPKFRNNTKLNNNFNDMEITLLLMMPLSQAKQPNELLNVKNFDKNIEGFMQQQKKHQLQQQQQHIQAQSVKKCSCFTLKSQHGSYGIKYTLRYVDIIGVELRECYHPQQRVNSNPIWIAGQSYQQTIYN